MTCDPDPTALGV
jgi:hypothetical protein